MGRHGVARVLRRQCGVGQGEETGAGGALDGERLPVYRAGPAIHAVEKAAISDQQKALIAGGNLRRLLREAKP